MENELDFIKMEKIKQGFIEDQKNLGIVLIEMNGENKPFQKTIAVYIFGINGVLEKVNKVEMN